MEVLKCPFRLTAFFYGSEFLNSSFLSVSHMPGQKARLCQGGGGVSIFRNSALFYAPLRVGTVRSAANRGGVQKVVSASKPSRVCTPVSRDSLLRWVGLRRRSVAEHAHQHSRSFLLNVKCKKQDRKLELKGAL